MNLRLLARIGGVYDVLLGVPMLAAPLVVARAFGAPGPVPVVNAQINGVFALALAVGYFWALRQPEPTLRGYLWVASVFAKGLGALVFVLDQLLRDSPAVFLVFALVDGTIAVWTLVALRARR
jgi:hypothetical protein